MLQPQELLTKWRGAGKALCGMGVKLAWIGMMFFQNFGKISSRGQRYLETCRSPEVSKALRGVVGAFCLFSMKRMVTFSAPNFWVVCNWFLQFGSRAASFLKIGWAWSPPGFV